MLDNRMGPNEKIARLLALIESRANDERDRADYQELKQRIDAGDLTIDEIQEMQFVVENVLGIPLSENG